VMKFITRA